MINMQAEQHVQQQQIGDGLGQTQEEMHLLGESEIALAAAGRLG